MIKAWDDEAWEDFQYWLTHDRKMSKRILDILKDIDRNHYQGIGKPEPLRGDLSGYWSRRIDKSNRLVYTIEDGMIKIIQCKSHYRNT
ncbi:Txe/YoeB family addiction module toxin [Alloscardovia venturai]|uniref:Endoribonuclease YoeB n=1 Tax=Alloscardovia venturai TaxID=1769421 RepID=A0ABW2Y269_9BIFI